MEFQGGDFNTRQFSWSPLLCHKNDSGRDNRKRAVFLAGGPNSDFDVLTQSRKKFHEASNREVASAVPHQQGDLRLLHAENFGDLHLPHAAVLEDRIDLQRELRLEQLLLGIGKTKVCEDVPAAFGHAGNSMVRLFGFVFHSSSAFPDNRVRPRQATHLYTSIHILVYRRQAFHDGR